MTITKNKVVSIDYTLTDEKNNLIDSTDGQEPLDYLHGFENIIPGLEKALEGKSLGDHFSVRIPAAEAYGDRNEQLISEIPLEQFDGIDGVQPGMQFQVRSPGGARQLMVTEVGDTTVTVDGNHPLAGMDLNFAVTVAGIRDAREEELSHGHVHGSGHCGCGGGCEDHGDADRGSCGCEGGCCGH